MSPGAPPGPHFRLSALTPAMSQGGSGEDEESGGRLASRCTPVKCRHFMRIFLAHLFSHVGLCGLVVGYAIVGALTFEALEAKHELAQRKEIQQYRDRCVDDLWMITLELNVLYQENWTRLIRNRLRDFEQAVVAGVKSEGYDGKEVNTELQWSFSGALLYCVTVITTIGYGNIAPKTSPGKVVTILYALMGIPLMLLCLTNIGDLFAHAFKFAYARLCCVLCRDNRKYHRGTSNHRSPRSLHCDSAVKYVAPPSKAPVASVDSVVDGSESESNAAGPNNPRKQQPTGGTDSPQHQRLLAPNNNGGGGTLKRVPSDSGAPSDSDGGVQVNIERASRLHDMVLPSEARVPIYLVLSFVSGYICLGALIFSLWEEWTFLNGAYFCFITLSTIGFGDLVPGTSILDTRSEAGQAKLIICCFYLILGLSIIAMSFNLVQEEVTAKCKQIGRNLGILVDEDNDD